MGALILCGTPIGNLEDVTLRLLRVLSEADVVACEDTRRFRKLLTHHGVTVKDLVTYNEQNERRQAQALLRRIANGDTVALVTDAGMPGLSDPGYRLVRACATEGLDVTVVPGPTASVSALAVSAMPPARFVFEGFLPRKSGDRRRRLEELKNETRTVVLYESPHRIEAALEDMVAVLGHRSAALVRELTKLHEEVRRGTLAALLAALRQEPVRGEIVLVVEGAIHDAREKPGADELAARAKALMEAGVTRKEAMAQVAREAGVARRAVFDALVDTDRTEES